MRDIYVCGDTHGDIEPILKLPKNSVCIHVGDWGAGPFWLNDQKLVGINRLFASKNIHVYVNRGNHDEPCYWDGTHDLSNITFVPDGIKDIEGYRFFFIGGAISVDRHERKIGSSYWPEERIDFVGVGQKLKESKSVQYVISHTAPHSFYPVFKNPFLRQLFLAFPDLEEDCNEERYELQCILEYFCEFSDRPKAWLYGHFHTSNIEFINGIKAVCLDINELRALE